MICRVILLLLYCSSLQAQTFNGAPFLGIGNTGIALRSIYSITNNASGLVGLSSPELAVGYQMDFVSSGLSSQAIFFGLPFDSNNTLGVAVIHNGLKGISSLSTISAAYARSFARNISVSITTNYSSLKITDYGSDQSFSVDIGLQIDILEELRLGAIFRNISSDMFVSNREQYLSSEIGLGIKYDVSKSIFLSSDLYFDNVRQLALRSGMSYIINNMFSIGLGMSTEGTQYYAGVGLYLRKFRINFSSSFHSQLGSSPQVAMSYAF